MSRPPRASFVCLCVAVLAIAFAPACAEDEGRAAGAGYETVGSTSEALTKKCGVAANGSVQGRDVSVYQGNFDWAAQKSSGVAFGYARISDGTGAVDSTFPGNWASMKAHGILRGAYQFFEPGQSEVTQANLMVQKVGKLGDGDLPAMIDVEATGGQTPATIAAKIKKWLQIVEAGTGKRPFIYTGAYFWQDNVKDTTLGQYPLWIANYGATCPLVPDGWSNWTIWQYSDGGGSLDHDVFNGTLAALQAIAGGGTPAPSFPPIVRRSSTDVNGDGASDVCGRAASGVVCELAGSGGFPVETTGPEWSDAKGWKDDRYGSTVQFADVNGDGKADVCGRANDGFTCVLSDGAKFATPIDGPPWSDAQGWDAAQYYSTIQLADVNGDGKVDACARGYAGIECYLADGHGFPTKITGPAWSDPEGWSAPQYYASIQYADVNGDGKVDVCGRGYAGVQCYLSDGNGFPTKVTGPAWSDPTGWADPSTGATVRLVDLDGDGKADICGRSPAGVRCALSKGDSFGDEIVGPEWSDAHGWNKPEYYLTLAFGDFDGDGKRDVCARAAAGVTCASFDGHAFGATYDGPAWTDAAGWNKPQSYMTIGAADVNHDGRDDLCGRTASGIVCATSHGGGFDAPFDGPAWSDKNGWGAGPYYLSIRYLGDPHPGADGPLPGNGNGGGNGSGGGPGGGSPVVGGGGGGDDGGCSLGASRGARSTGAAAAIAGLLGLALVVRRRRARR